MSKCCKTCEYLVVHLDKAGRRVVRKDFAYRCSFDIWSILAQLPDSSRVSRTTAAASSMCGDQGTECPCWKESVR
jgi:hypothetical protein